MANEKENNTNAGTFYNSTQNFLFSAILSMNFSIFAHRYSIWYVYQSA